MNGNKLLLEEEINNSLYISNFPAPTRRKSSGKCRPDQTTRKRSHRSQKTIRKCSRQTRPKGMESEI